MDLGTVRTLEFYCMSFHTFLVGAGRKLLVLLYCRYLITLTSSKAGNIVSKIQKNWCFPGKLEITKFIPKTTLVCFQGRSILVVSHNPASLMGLPDFYPVLLCSPYLQGVHKMLGSRAVRAPSDDS